MAQAIEVSVAGMISLQKPERKSAPSRNMRVLQLLSKRGAVSHSLRGARRVHPMAI
jgi:hypothetical protein